MSQTSVITRVAGGLLLFISLDALAFRSGYYARVLEQNSTAGMTQSYLAVERDRQDVGPHDVLALGDSRMPLKPGFAHAPGSPYRFFTIAIPGSTPRCWYYMLRDVDPTARRYAAIILPVDTYDDRVWEDLRGRELDLRYLAPLLRYSDLFSFSLSYPGWKERLAAAATVALKGLVYREDLQQFLVHHKRRMVEARWLYQQASGWRHDANWGGVNLAGIAVDWNAGVVRLPAGVDAKKGEETRNDLLQEQPPRTRETAEYRSRWFGAIAERYRGSRTQLVFMRLARGPVIRPGLVTDSRSTIRGLAARGDAVLIDEHHFDVLERPEYFVDGVHMNQPGAEAFSAMMARDFPGILAGAGR